MSIFLILFPKLERDISLLPLNKTLLNTGKGDSSDFHNEDNTILVTAHSSVFKYQQNKDCTRHRCNARQVQFQIEHLQSQMIPKPCLNHQQLNNDPYKYEILSGLERIQSALLDRHHKHTTLISFQFQ